MVLLRGLLDRVIRNWWSSRKGRHHPENHYSRWEQDHVLQNFTQLGLFYEYLEMGEIRHCSCRMMYEIMNYRSRFIDVYRKYQLITAISSPCDLPFPLHPSLSLIRLFDCRFSGAVWLHHSVCGLFPLGSSPGSVQQHPGGQGGRLEVHHPVQTTGGVQGPEHRRVAGDPQRGGHSVCCYQCELCFVNLSSLFLFTTVKYLIDSFLRSLLFQAFIMAFTSDMIPRMVYLYAYSKEASMRGYVNNSLSIYNISQIPDRNMPEERDNWFENLTATCRYQGKTQ